MDRMMNYARAFWVAGATAMLLGFGAPAWAVINLTPDTTAATPEMAGKVKIARETLMMGDANTTTVGGVTYYHVTDTGDALDVQVDRGIVAGAASVYYRMSLENMVFVGTTAVTVADAGDGTAGGPHGGGAAKDNYILFSTSGTGATTDNLTLTIAALGVLPDMPGNIKVEVFRNAFDAQAGTNAIGSLTKMLSGAVTVVDGISARGTPGTSVADVSTGFKQLTGGADMTQIGRLRITLDTTALDQASGAIVDFEDVLGTTAPVVVTFKGNFSVGTYTLNTNMNCAADNDPTTVVASTVADDGDMMKAKLTPDAQPAAAGTGVDWYLCLMVAEDNDMPLPEGAFTAALEYGAVANAMGGGREDQTVAVGSIARNGTTVQIPYLTTYMGYNQRIVLSNRSSAEAKYMIEFRPEMGVTPTAGDMAEGMLMPMSTKTLRAMDVVMLEGGARTAATITVVADPKMIDVTSVIINKETRGTDTVVHHSGM